MMTDVRIVFECSLGFLRLLFGFCSGLPGRAPNNAEEIPNKTWLNVPAYPKSKATGAPANYPECADMMFVFCSGMSSVCFVLCSQVVRKFAGKP
jgi:hypothetical protein